MRIVRWVAAAAAALLVVLLVLLGRLGAADPTVRLRHELGRAGYAHARVDVSRARAESAPLGAVDVTVEFDPEGQPPAAVAARSSRAAELVWLRGRVYVASVIVRPEGSSSLTRDVVALATVGPAAAHRERYDAVQRRATLVVILALLAVFLTAALVVCASAAAVVFARRGPVRRDGARRDFVTPPV